MWPWSIPCWLGAVALAGWGGVLVSRGLFGRFNIASTTRRCPRCLYDMTATAGTSMTCPECGLVAGSEDVFYSGRRRPWLVLMGLLLCIIALGLASRPTARRTGYMAFLPMSIQVQIWPEWRRAAKTINIDHPAHWNYFQEQVDLLKYRQNADYIYKAAYIECLGVLQSKPRVQWMSDDAAYILNLLRFSGFEESELSFVSTKEIQFLMASSDANAAEAGVQLAGLLVGRYPELVRVLYDWQPPTRSFQIETAGIAYDADKLNGRKVFNEIINSGEVWTSPLALRAIESRIWEDEKDYDYLLAWLQFGHEDTRVCVVETICDGFLAGRKGKMLDTWLGPEDIRTIQGNELIDAMLDFAVDYGHDPAYKFRLMKMQNLGSMAATKIAERLCETDHELVAELLLDILRGQGERARYAVPVIEEFIEDYACSEELRTKARATIEAIKEAYRRRIRVNY